jgi:hypothetical protein
VISGEERAQLFRFRTGGPIGLGLAGYGTRVLLVPSADHNLYAIDLFTAESLWSFASGAPIEQEPVVADEDICVINTAGNLSVLRPADGVARWTTSTYGGRLVAVSGTKIYLRSHDLDLFVVERQSGRIVFDPGETHLRLHLNLREYDQAVVNRANDRIYLGSNSGMIVCLREAALPQPRLLRDPKARPFGYVPPEGIRPTPPATPSVTPEAGAEAKPEAAPAKDEEAPPKEKPKGETKPDEAAPKDEPKR